MRNEYQPPPPVDWHQPVRSPDSTVVQSWLRTAETLPNLLRAGPGTYHYYQGRCLAASLRASYLAEGYVAGGFRLGGGRTALPHTAHGGQYTEFPTCVGCQQTLDQACGAQLLERIRANCTTAPRPR